MSFTNSKPGDNPARRLFDFYHRCIDEMQATGTHDAERLNSIVEAMGDLTGAPDSLAERIQPRFPGWTFEPSEAFGLMYPLPLSDRPEIGLAYVDRNGALVVLDATSRQDFAKSIFNILQTLIDERINFLPEVLELPIRRILERASEKLLAQDVANPWSQRSAELPYAEAREGFAMLKSDNLAWTGFQVCQRRKPVYEPLELAHAPRPQPFSALYLSAATRWFLSCCRPAAGSALILPTAADIELLRRVRHEIRVAEGGGGMCHLVTDFASGHFPTQSRTPVCYLSEEREPISGAHYVNVLPDGTIVDATADQFGEGQDIAIVRPWDTRYFRYRMEWHGDFNPSNDASCAAAAEALGISWTGESDEEVAVSLERSRGYSWWLNDVIDYAAYLDRTIGYAEAAGDTMCGHGPDVALRALQSMRRPAFRLQ